MSGNGVYQESAVGTPRSLLQIRCTLGVLGNFRKELLGLFIWGEIIVIKHKYRNAFKFLGVKNFGSGGIALVTNDRRVYIKGIRKNRNLNRMERNFFYVLFQR